MKKLMTLALAAALLLGSASGVQAVDFKAKGWWQFGFGVGETSLVNKINNHKGPNKGSDDMFGARSRVRLQLDAVASEALSGTVFFEIGNMKWGNAQQGAAIGADGTIVKVRQAYLDWMPPSTDLKIRMGIMNMSLPSAASFGADGGNMLHNTDMAGISAAFTFNDMVGLTLLWARPFNDGGFGRTSGGSYLDNADAFAIVLPINGAGFSITPWAAYCFYGKNVANSAGQSSTNVNDRTGISILDTMHSNPFGHGYPEATMVKKPSPWTSFYGIGLPIKISALDPFNMEFDLMYAVSESFGKYEATRYNYGQSMGTQRVDSKREGWLIKALFEYKMDWGTPGLFAWYGSGDDGSLKNGSERLPYIYSESKHSSLLGEDVAYPGGFTDMKMSLDGSWGVGVQLKNLSFMEDLKHTVRVLYMNGTNSTKMTRYAASLGGANRVNNWDYGAGGFMGIGNDIYLTEKDALVEVDINSYYKIYDNLMASLQLSYMFNMIDKKTWKKPMNEEMSLKDIWGVELTLNYTF